MTKSIFTTEYERFRQRLIDERLRASLTQTELATVLHRPQSYVSKYERGERRLDVVEFLDVARAMKLDPCDVIRTLDGTRSTKRARR